MRRAIVAAGLFWLGVLLLVGSGLSVWASVQADEGLADLGYAILAVFVFALAGGLHGAFLLLTPRPAPRAKLVVATVVAALTLLALGGLVLLGIGMDAGRLAFVVAFAAVPAAAGLARAVRLWRRSTPENGQLQEL